MSNITKEEQSYFEELFGMKKGYVLDFSDDRFKSFIYDIVNMDIENQKYLNGKTTSKANRLREFIRLENNYVVSKVLDALLDKWRITNSKKDKNFNANDNVLFNECKKCIDRLSKLQINKDILDLNNETQDSLIEQITLLINNNHYSGAIPYLHTYMVRYFRILCEKHDISYSKKDTLQQLGLNYRNEFIKKYNIEDSSVCSCILRSSLGMLDKFNEARNHKSFAHDNKILNENESRYMIKSILNLKEYIDSLELQS